MTDPSSTGGAKPLVFPPVRRRSDNCWLYAGETLLGTLTPVEGSNSWEFEPTAAFELLRPLFEDNYGFFGDDPRGQESESVKQLKKRFTDLNLRIVYPGGGADEYYYLMISGKRVRYRHAFRKALGIWERE